MPSPLLYYAPRGLLTIVAGITAVVPYLADFNITHVYNPSWPGHARFHNGQTMSLGVFLGVTTLWKTWSPTERDNLWTAAVLASGYYLTMASAYYYPGATAWDPPLQHFAVPYPHLFVVFPMLAMVGLAYGLERRRVARSPTGTKGE